MGLVEGRPGCGAGRDGLVGLAGAVGTGSWGLVGPGGRRQAASMAVQTHLAALAARPGLARCGPSRSSRTARARILGPNPTITVISTTPAVGPDGTVRRPPRPPPAAPPR